MARPIEYYLKFVLLILVTNISFSQNEANIWYFGENAGLDFNSGIPVALTDGQMDTIEGCASISDENGNLLFYTNGVNIWDKNHQVMPNGAGLNGHPSSTNAALIVPKPSSPNLYYVFTLDERGNSNGLQYSEVDMSLNSGNGDVTNSKNILLETPVAEKITAVKVKDEDAYWVIAHRWNSTDFIVYKVSSTGIITTPVVSSVGSYLGGFSTNSMGAIKVSPDGTKLARANLGLYEAQLFNFDDVTGVVSNPLTVLSFNMESSVYGIEFSPNSSLLYVSVTLKGIYQFQMSDNSTEILNSQTQVGIYSEWNKSLQLGPDGKIYVALTGDDFLDVINNPNIIGTGCNYISDAVFLNGSNSESGLPPFIQSFFNVGIQAEDVCEGEETVFVSNISQAYDSLVWDFGDGTMSIIENATHTYANAGNYDVSLTVTMGTESSVDHKTITIYETPVVNTLVTLQQCDDNLDGYSNFNLNEAIGEITNNAANETISFYESLSDAESANNPITEVTSYTNETVTTDSIWARVENEYGCYTTAQLNLIVSTTQIPDTFTREFYQCDDGTDTSDGIATFDFSSVTSDVEALFPAGQQLMINYYRNLEDALSEINPITDTENYQNIGYPYNQDIYIRVDSALTNDCLGLGNHITLQVEEVPIANSVIIEEQCDVDGDGLYEFDTSGVEAALLNGQTGFTTEYFDYNGDPISSPLPNPFITGTQDITARVINTNAQDPDGQCYDETIISFVVQAAAVAHPLEDYVACDLDNDGFVDFDTSGIEAQILNGQSGMSVTYFDASGNTLNSPLPNPFNTDTQTITVRVENDLSSSCYDESTINFVVHQQPVAYSIVDDFVCDDITNVSIHTFDLSSYDNEVLSGQSDAMFGVSYFDSEENAENNQGALPNFYDVSSDTVTLYARIQNISHDSCYDITTFNIGVSHLPIATKPNDMSVCDDDSNDGIENFNLNEQDFYILNGMSPVSNTITYHLSEEDAELSNNALDVSFINTENPQTIYARLENNHNPECFTTTSFELYVQEKPELIMEDEYAICEEGTVQLAADLGYDYYDWSTGETTRLITVSEPGQYTVTVSNAYGDLICSTDKTVNVTLSNTAIITEIETEDWSQYDNWISVYVDGHGDYEYSLDGEIYQDSNVFSGLYPDEYTVHVRDKNGCGITTNDVYLLYYPKFFTPNGDGENDFWQIKHSVNEPLNKLYIYDRYGKFIIQLKPNDFGWDGLYNGERLPSSDYWFVLERENGKTYTGHFSLKR